MLSTLCLIVSLSHGGFLADAPPRQVRLVEDLAVGQGATRQDLQERLSLLEDSRPSKTIPLALLIGGGALMVGSLPVAYILDVTVGLSQLTVLTVFGTLFVIGAVAAITGVIWFVVTLAARHRIDRDMKALQQQLQREEAPSPPPLPPSVSAPGPEAHWQVASF